MSHYTLQFQGTLQKEYIAYIAVTEPSVVLPLGLIQNAAKNRFISWKTRNVEQPNPSFVQTIRFKIAVSQSPKEKTKKRNLKVLHVAFLSINVFFYSVHHPGHFSTCNHQSSWCLKATLILPLFFHTGKHLYELIMQQRLIRNF